MMYDLDQLKYLLFSEDESNFDLAMTLAKGLDIASWQVYIDLNKSAEFLNQQWRIPHDIRTCLREVRQRQFTLPNRNLHHLPPYLEVLETLIQTANLANNKFTAVPHVLGAFRQLQTLDLSHNTISELDEMLWNLSALQTLKLNGNAVYKIPTSVQRAQRLESLQIVGKYYAELPATLPIVSNLRHLAWGQLGQNPRPAPYNGIPSVIWSCASLRWLELYGDSIAELPPSVGKLSNLTHLSLQNVAISALPDALASLVNLETLEIRTEGTFERLPFVLTQLPKLQKLVFISESTPKIPDYVAQLQHLETLLIPMDWFRTPALAQLRQYLPTTTIQGVWR